MAAADSQDCAVRTGQVSSRLPYGTPDPAALAVLVGLRPPECHHQAGRREVQILDIEAHQLAAPQGAGEPQQEQGAVAQPGESVGLGRDHCSEVGNDGGRLAILVGAVRALDAGKRFPDGSGTGIELVPGCPVGGRDGHQVAGKGAGPEASGLGGQVEAHGLRCCWKGQKAGRRGPDREIAPVGGVGAAGVLGPAGPHVGAGAVARLLDQGGHIGDGGSCVWRLCLA